MPAAQDQFNFAPAPIKGSRLEPRLWVKDFGFFSDFKATAEVRRVSLRRGLNIIWAKESEEGASGHAAGKSTFCRLLRYMLGDTSYGSEDFRHALRERFPDAVLIAEVRLGGEAWLLCRPISDHGYHWAARGSHYEQAFDPDLKKEHFNTFQKQLKQSFIDPLGKDGTYPGSGKEIEWHHLLQWLTRDQDARYAGSLIWRPGGESKTTQASEKVNLIRLVLDLLSEEEQAQQREHAALLSERNELKTQQPLLIFSRDRTLPDLQKEFPKLKKQNDLLFELKAQIKISKQDLSDAKGKKKTANETDGIDDVLRESLRQATSERDSAQRRYDANTRSLTSARNTRDYRSKKLSKEEFRAAQAKLPPSEGICSHPIELAQAFQCPLAPPSNRDELAAERLESFRGDAQHAVSEIARLESNEKTLKESLEAAQTALKPLQDRADTVKTAHIDLKDKLDDDITELQSLFDKLEEVETDSTEIGGNRERLAELDIEIETSTKDLQELRKKMGRKLSRLTEDFNNVATYLTRQKVNGSVKFKADALDATMNYKGDHSSAALITLRLLIFDLTALLGSVRETSHHPGFLLHDSPREADLSVHIYRRLFTLIADPDNSHENEAVQYIIATTEAPPENVKTGERVRCELSSAIPKERLLKVII